MALLTLEEMKQHVETDLPDDAIQLLMDSAEQLIDRNAGAVGTATQNYHFDGFPQGKTRQLFLTRGLTSITSVKERQTIDDAQVTLASNDYRIENGRILIRLSGGTNPRTLWAPNVEVIYEPVSDLDMRKRIQVDLVKLSIQYTGDASQKFGDETNQHGELSQENAKVAALIRPLLNGKNRFALS